MTVREKLLDAMAHKTKVDFSDYESAATSLDVPDSFLMRELYWKDFNPNKAVEILKKYKKFRVLGNAIKKWNGINEEDIINFLAKNKYREVSRHFTDWGEARAEMYRSALLRNNSKNLKSKPLKLKEEYEYSKLWGVQRISEKSFDEMQKYFDFDLRKFLNIKTREGNYWYRQVANFERTKDRIDYLKNSLPAHAKVKDALQKYYEPIKWTERNLSKVKSKAQKLPSAPLKLKENKMNLRNYLEEKEEKLFEEELNESVSGAVGTVLGYVGVGAILAFGGTLLVLGGKKYVLKLKELWQKILGNRKPKEDAKEKTPDETMKEIETDAAVKAEKIKLEEKKRAFEEQLHEVYIAIEARDFDKAKQEFLAVDRNLQNSPDVHKAIIMEITKTLKEPPLYVKSPGNNSYQAIKRVINIRVARASAKATEMALASAAG